MTTLPRRPFVLAAWAAAAAACLAPACRPAGDGGEGPGPHPAVEHPGRLKPDGEGPESHPAVMHAKQLKPEEFDRYVDELGRKKDFAALEALYRADFQLQPGYKFTPRSSYAAAVYCRNLDPERAVAFCTRLELGSSAWVAGAAGLLDHPRGQVVGYFKQVATTSDMRVRCLCYVWF